MSRDPIFVFFGIKNLPLLRSRALFDHLLPVLGSKPIVLSFLEPALGLNNSNPIVEEVECVKIPFFQGEADGLFGKRSFEWKKKLLRIF